MTTEGKSSTEAAVVEATKDAQAETGFLQQPSEHTAANQLARKADWGLEEGNLDEAADLFSQALAIDPHYSYAQLGLARTHMEREAPEAALPLLDKLIETFPGDHELLNERGLALLDLERYEEAASLFQALIEEDPQYPAPYANLGALHEETGEFALSITAYQSYLEWSNDTDEADAVKDRIAQMQRRMKRAERRKQRSEGVSEQEEKTDTDEA